MNYLKIILPLLAFLQCNPARSQSSFPTKFELSGRKETATYQEGISYYERLAKAFPEIDLKTYGTTDSGKPLHLITLSTDQDFDFANLHNKNKLILLINNAIHPGEPDGVDASMMLVRDLMLKREEYESQLENVVITLIPFYNIGGTLNRNSTTRANQNGPMEYGFRGNARNFDLNRDFIKSDTLNARTFARLFHHIDPDIFIDNHVSNGADYQYVMTIDITQKDKLGGSLSDYLEMRLMPFMIDYMKAAGSEMIPYVNVFGEAPDKGYSQFFDSPRYSSGYAALFHTIGFMTEPHMLKPYEERVQATYDYMEGMIKIMSRDRDQIKRLRAQTKESVRTQPRFDIAWNLDKTRHTNLLFKGYEASQIKSQVTGQTRLFYDQTQPFEKRIPYYNHYRASVTISKPEYYVVPQAWRHVLELLELNQVRLEPIKEDISMEAEVYHIEDYKTVASPYEGHYLHYDVKIRTEKETVRLSKGDIMVPVNQWVNRYIVETLEPEGVDSFFAWNFFDTILQRKEGFSSYVFEDEAKQILEDNPDLQSQLEQMQASDPEFANDSQAQLNFIYKNSPHYEKAHLRYPIYRVLKR